MRWVGGALLASKYLSLIGNLTECPIVTRSEKPQGEKGEQRGVNQKMNEIRRMFRVWIVFHFTLAIRDTQTPDTGLTCE